MWGLGTWRQSEVRLPRSPESRCIFCTPPSLSSVHKLLPERPPPLSDRRREDQTLCLDPREGQQAPPWGCLGWFHSSPLWDWGLPISVSGR